MISKRYMITWLSPNTIMITRPWVSKTKINVLTYNFGWRLYKNIKKFLGKRPIFQPSHMQDLMDDGNDIYKPTK